MDFDETVMKWRQSKSRSAVRRLDAFCSRRYEYKGKQFGHPSTYALVRFECAPADSLVFEMQAEWPADLTTEYRRLLEAAMSAAIIDVLVACENPHTGCHLRCVEVGWDEICSSELAFYRATKEAMIALRDEEKWSFVPRKE